MVLEIFNEKNELVNNATGDSLKQKNTCNIKCSFDSVDQSILVHLSENYEITGI